MKFKSIRRTSGARSVARTEPLPAFLMSVATGKDDWDDWCHPGIVFREWCGLLAPVCAVVLFEFSAARCLRTAPREIPNV